MGFVELVISVPNKRNAFLINAFAMIRHFAAHLAVNDFLIDFNPSVTAAVIDRVGHEVVEDLLNAGVIRIDISALLCLNTDLIAFLHLIDIIFLHLRLNQR